MKLEKYFKQFIIERSTDFNMQLDDDQVQEIYAFFLDEDFGVLNYMLHSKIADMLDLKQFEKKSSSRDLGEVNFNMDDENEFTN